MSQFLHPSVRSVSKFGRKQSEKGVTKLRDSHAHVLASFALTSTSPLLYDSRKNLITMT